MEAKGCRLGDEQAKYAVTGRERADAFGQPAVYPYGDKMTEGIVFADDAQGPVACLKQLACGGHYAVEHRFKTQVFRYGDNCLKQAPGSFLSLQKLPGARYEVLQQVIDGDPRFWLRPTGPRGFGFVH
ncbi:hypothetical protein GCM10010523_01090 [Paenarthrobacter ilicis]